VTEEVRVIIQPAPEIRTTIVPRPSLVGSFGVKQGPSGPPGPAGPQGEPGAQSVRKFSETLATSATSYEVWHGLGTLDVTVAVHLVATGERVFTGLFLTSEDVVTLRFAVAPPAGEYRVVVQG